VSSPRSGGVTVARRFNAGECVVGCSRRVATTDFPIILNYFQPSRSDANVSSILPGVETPG